MSALLDALIEQRKREALDYRDYLDQIVELTKKAKSPAASPHYPKAVDTRAKRAFYDDFDGDVDMAIKLDQAVQNSLKDEWRGHLFKERNVKLAIKEVVGDDDVLVDRAFELAVHQDEY